MTAGTAKDTLVLEYNDTEALERVFEERGDKIAALLMEPVVGNMGLVEPSREFLQTARTITEKHGAILVFDEVMTGFSARVWWSTGAIRGNSRYNNTRKDCRGRPSARCLRR